MSGSMAVLAITKSAYHIMINSDMAMQLWHSEGFLKASTEWDLTDLEKVRFHL